MNNIGLEDSEKAAVAMLLAAAAAQIAEAPAAAAPPESSPEPVGVDDLQKLFQKQKQLQEELAVLKGREAELTREMQSMREQHSELECQAESVKTKAKALFETLFGNFGKVEHQIPRAQTPAPSQVAKAEVDASENLSPQARQITSIPSLSL